jgi:predicted RNA-binding Zn-ribbon protein involved in translation (DUF1610 family)
MNKHESASEIVRLSCPNCGKKCKRRLKFYDNGVVADEFCPQCGYLMQEL